MLFHPAGRKIYLLGIRNSEPFPVSVPILTSEVAFSGDNLIANLTHKSHPPRVRLPPMFFCLFVCFVFVFRDRVSQ